jgi:hypothetical protein
VHLPLVAARAAVVLDVELWAGASYPGELLSAATAVPVELLAAWPGASRLRELARRALIEGHGAVCDGMDAELHCEIARDLRGWLDVNLVSGEPVLTLKPGPAVDAPRSLPLSIAPEITIGSSPTATISLPRPRSGLAGTHAVVTRVGADRLRLELQGHEGRCGGRRSLDALELELGDGFELGAVGFWFHRAGEPLEDERPDVRGPLREGLEYLRETAAWPVFLGADALGLVDRLLGALEAASLERSIAAAKRHAVADAARRLRALVGPGNATAAGGFIDVLFDLARLVAGDAIDGPPPSVEASARLARLGLSHLAGNPEALAAERARLLAAMEPDVRAWHAEQARRFAADFERAWDDDADDQGEDT